MDFLYEVKTINKKVKMSFIQMKKRLIQHIPETLKHKVEECCDWEELLDICEHNKKMFKQNKLNFGQIINKNDNKLINKFKKKVECYLCNGDHYASSCDLKDRGKKKSSEKNTYHKDQDRSDKLSRSTMISKKINFKEERKI